VLDRVFEQMQRLRLIRLRLEVVPRTAQAAAPAGAARSRIRTPSPDLMSGPPKFVWAPRIRVDRRRLKAARWCGTGGVGPRGGITGAAESPPLSARSAPGPNRASRRRGRG
jgi:hypothetical protein